MSEIFQTKFVVNALAALTLVALVVLSASVQRAHFKPPQLIGRAAQASSAQTIDASKIGNDSLTLPGIQQVLVLFAASAFILIIAMWISPRLRTRLLRAFIRLALFLALLYYFLKENPNFFSSLFRNLTIANPPPGALAVSNLPPPLFQPPQVAGWFSYFIALAAVLGLGALLLWAGRLWGSAAIGALPPRSFEALAGIARDSLSELQSGRNFDNAIIECYARMSAVIAHSRGLHRDLAMTPTEFAQRLTRAGLPPEPVGTLTRIFEAVRYGGRGIGEPELRAANNSLKAIAQFCGAHV